MKTTQIRLFIDKEKLLNKRINKINNKFILT